MQKSLMPRIRDSVLLLLSLLLAVSAIPPNANGNVVAAQSLPSGTNDDSIGDYDDLKNYIGFERNDIAQYEDEDNQNIEIENNNSNENTVDSGNPPPANGSLLSPVYFSLLPSSYSKEANNEVRIADPSSVLNLTLSFAPMFPNASRSYPILGNVYKAYHSFDEGPIDAEWATFEGGPSGLARTKCTIEGRDDFDVSNFMREGETRVDIKEADYIWCVTTL